MIVNNIKLSLNQLISADLFLGYHVSNRNSAINYFLLGKYRRTDIFNINLTYTATKKFVTVVSDLLVKKCHFWLVNDQFSLFLKNSQLVGMSAAFREINLIYKRWSKGTLSNYKYVGVAKLWRFPHAIFFPGMSNNFYIINECSAVNIPAFSLTDSSDNPLNTTFSIPAASKSVRSLFYFYMLIARIVSRSRHIISASFVSLAFSKVKHRHFASFIKRYGWFRSILCKTYLSRFEQFFSLKSKVFLIDNLWLSSKLFSIVAHNDIEDRFTRRFFINWFFLFLLSVLYVLNTLRLVFIGIFKSPPILEKYSFSFRTRLVFSFLMH
jgi:ribosomal protein S2